MSAGNNAAEETKGFFKGIHQVGEDARKEVNSFADGLIGGNKTHKSTGFSEDAKAVGNSMNQAANDASSKTSESASQTQKGHGL